MENANVLVEEKQQPEFAPKKKEKKLQKIGKNTPVDYMIIIVLAIFAFVCFYPIWYTLIGSLNNGTDYAKGGVLWLPRVFTLANYQAVFADNRIWAATAITVLRCLIGPTLLVFFTALVAYGMSRKYDLRGYKTFNIFFMITMFVIGGTIP